MAGRLDKLDARVLADGLRVVQARRPLARLRGLAGLRELDPDVGLELPRCRSVHTIGMRFALDLIWLGADGAVVHVDRAVPAWRARSCRHARAVVEVAAGRGDAFAAALAAEVRRGRPGTRTRS
jgi:uncharacterized membrane protein (UPF0127 family)